MVEQVRVLMSDRLHGAMAVHAKHDETRSTGGISASQSSHRADDYSVPSSGDRHAAKTSATAATCNCVLQVWQRRTYC